MKVDGEGLINYFEDAANLSGAIGIKHEIANSKEDILITDLKDSIRPIPIRAIMPNAKSEEYVDGFISKEDEKNYPDSVQIMKIGVAHPEPELFIDKISNICIDESVIAHNHVANENKVFEIESNANIQKGNSSDYNIISNSQQSRANSVKDNNIHETANKQEETQLLELKANLEPSYQAIELSAETGCIGLIAREDMLLSNPSDGITALSAANMKAKANEEKGTNYKVSPESQMLTRKSSINIDKKEKVQNTLKKKFATPEQISRSILQILALANKASTYFVQTQIRNLVTLFVSSKNANKKLQALLQVIKIKNARIATGLSKMLRKYNDIAQHLDSILQRNSFINLLRIVSSKWIGKKKDLLSRLKSYSFKVAAKYRLSILVILLIRHFAIFSMLKIRLKSRWNKAKQTIKKLIIHKPQREQTLWMKACISSWKSRSCKLGENAINLNAKSGRKRIISQSCSGNENFQSTSIKNFIDLKDLKCKIEDTLSAKIGLRNDMLGNDIRLLINLLESKTNSKEKSMSMSTAKAKHSNASSLINTNTGFFLQDPIAEKVNSKNHTAALIKKTPIQETAYKSNGFREIKSIIGKLNSLEPQYKISNRLIYNYPRKSKSYAFFP